MAMEIDIGFDSAASISSNKRKHDALNAEPPHSTLHEPLRSELDSTHASSPPSSPAIFAREELPASIHETTSIGAQRAYIARTAPHLLDNPTPSLSRSPSAPPSGRSSPSSEDDHATSGHAHRAPSSSSSSSLAKNVSALHKPPPGFRGPVPLATDSEDLVRRPQLVTTPGSATLFTTINFPVNRNQWRYTGAGPATQQLPTTVYKTLPVAPTGIHWCWSDRSVFSRLSKDANTFSTDKGFRSSRTNVGVRQGEWYAEVEILAPEQTVVGMGGPGPVSVTMKDGPHVRVGWGRREASLNAPAGVDGYSYAFRDRTGDKVTLSRPQPYGKPFQAGDVVGLYIKLPPEREPEDEWDPAKIRRVRVPIRYKGQLYFEALEYGRSKEMEQLMDRSRKGMNPEEAIKSINDEANGEAASDPSGAAGPGAGSTSTGGSAKVKNKNRKAPSGAKEKVTGPQKARLRALPRLHGSKMGFFVNGEPQGIAFTDLLDYRPLRVKGTDSTPTGKGGKGGGAGAGATAAKDGRKEADAAPVIRSRENVFDDGALGYFPFVSCYGNARAKLITGEEGFRFPPPSDIEGALLEVDRRKANAVDRRKSNGTTDPAEPQMSADADGGSTTSTVATHSGGWRPLCERYDEHVAEQWRHDLADEERAAQAAAAEAEKQRRKKPSKPVAASAKSSAVAPDTIVVKKETAPEPSRAGSKASSVGASASPAPPLHHLDAALSSALGVDEGGPRPIDEIVTPPPAVPTTRVKEEEEGDTTLDRARSTTPIPQHGTLQADAERWHQQRDRVEQGLEEANASQIEMMFAASAAQHGMDDEAAVEGNTPPRSHAGPDVKVEEIVNMSTDAE